VSKVQSNEQQKGGINIYKKKRERHRRKKKEEWGCTSRLKFTVFPESSEAEEENMWKGKGRTLIKKNWKWKNNKKETEEEE
jgi:hypothetical protein